MKLMVIDGNSILNRAFYGIRLLSNSAGLYTNAVYGFLNILQKLLADDAPDALCVTFDRKEPTFRHKLSGDYKATRKGMPDELSVQVPYIKSVLDAMNVPRYELAGWEADDLIGTISRRCEAAGWDCLAVTGDRDSLQLITERTHVKLVTTKMGRNEYLEYDEAVFEEKYGFAPLRLIDLKALMGDSSDNIKGVPGVGEKTAAELLKSCGTLQGVFEAAEKGELKPAVAKKLEAGRESAELSYTLATIVTDAPLDFAPEEARLRPVNNDELYRLFTELEFTKLMDKYGLTPPAGETAPASALPEYVWERVVSLDALRDALASLPAGPVAVYADGALREFAVGAKGRFFVWDGEAERAEALRLLYALSEKLGFQIKDTQRALLEAGLPISGWRFDASLAAYLLDPSEGDYSPERIARRYLGLELDAAAEGEQLSLLAEPESGEKQAARAAALEALYPVLTAKLGEAGMTKLYEEIELPLCPVLAEMEKSGCLVDREALIRYGKELGQNIELFENLVYTEAGEKFNINSPKQLGVVLFEKLGLPPLSRTKSGYSTNAEVLEKLSGKHPIIDAILSYRQYTKLKSTYADGLLAEIAADGRIHSKFNMTVTATGRLSSAEPNLQNIPVRTPLGAEFRKMFVAPEGWVLVDADYSQIELRLLAHISGDETMLASFAAGQDIHRSTAAQVFHVPPEEVTPLQRSRAKAVNFGIVYGISDFSLAQDIHVTRAEAKEYIERYLDTYSGVKRYMKEVVEQAKKDGYVSTLFGRRRFLPELQSKNFNLRSFAERAALNTPIQGTAADVIKLAMVRVARRFEAEGMAARLILQVHDELIAQCPAEEAERACAVLTEEMENVAQLSVKLVADAHAGRSWHEAKG